MIDLSDGPWPSTPVTSSFPRDFCKHLWDADKQFNGDRRVPAFGVIHIACHCVTQQSPATDYLILAYGKSSAQVEVSTIEREFLQLQTLQDESTRPLVFLNACSGAVLDPAKPSSLPKDLLRENYLGFIGTETDIPDTLASEFSQSFYRNWLAGSPL